MAAKGTSRWHARKQPRRGTARKARSTLQGKTLDSMNQIWLAGLGAVAKAQRGAPQLLQELIAEGTRVHAKTRGAAEKAMQRHRRRCALDDQHPPWRDAWSGNRRARGSGEDIPDARASRAHADWRAQCRGHRGSERARRCAERQYSKTGASAQGSAAAPDAPGLGAAPAARNGQCSP